MVVDAVSDVITLTPEQMRPVPEFNAAMAGQHLLAMGVVGERMLILVDIEQLMSATPIRCLRNAAAAASPASAVPRPLFHAYPRRT